MQQNRYLRHSIIDWFDQDYLGNLNIAVIGAGALGNETIKNLALLGCGYIDIYDFDTIEEHNLTRSVLFNETDIGKNKAEVVALKAQSLDPNLKVNWYSNNIITFLNPSKIQKYDMVFCCVDNFEARIYLNKLCLLMSIDLINMGMDSKYQSNDFFPFSKLDNCACYECNLPYSVYDRLQKRYSCGGLKKLSYIEKKIPTTIITSSMAALGVSMGLRLGKDIEIEHSTRLLIDTISGISKKMKYFKSNDCPTCTLETTETKVLTFLDGKFTSIKKNDNLTFFLSENILKHIECSNCGYLEEFDKYIYTPASIYDDSLTICPNCNKQSVKIDLTDMLESSELEYICTGNELNIAYITCKVENITYAICKGELNE